jgi:hypothetical protein
MKFYEKDAKVVKKGLPTSKTAVPMLISKWRIPFRQKILCHRLPPWLSFSNWKFVKLVLLYHVQALQSLRTVSREYMKQIIQIFYQNSLRMLWPKKFIFSRFLQSQLLEIVTLEGYALKMIL